MFSQLQLIWEGRV